MKMNEKKLNKIIGIIRESMMVGIGGYTGSADPAGPNAGYDPVMKKPKKGKKYASLGPNSRKRWMQKDAR